MEAQDSSVSTVSNGGALVATAAVMLSLTWFSIGLRGYVRAVLVKSFQTDDWMLLAAQINFTVSCGFILRGCYHGLGRHNMSLSQPSEIDALKYQALATATYVLNMWLIKLSIAIFLLRIAIQRRYRWTIYISMGIVTVWSLALFFWDVFQCTPVPAQWDYTILKRDPSAVCASADAVIMAAYALSVMNILSDWLYALLPIPMIWNVKMTIEAKLTVSLVLGLGIFASVATLVRLKFLSDLTDTKDILHSGTDAMVWTLIEPGVAIIASSLATIRPLLRAMGIRGFQFSEHSARPRGLSGTHPKTNQSHDRRGSCLGSADATLSDIELARTKTRPSRAPSDAGTLASRGLPPRFSAQRMSRVEEAMRDGGHAPPRPWRPDVDDSDDGGEEEDDEDEDPTTKSIEAGLRRVEIRRNLTSNNNNNHNNNNKNKNTNEMSTVNYSKPRIPQTLHPEPTWPGADRPSSGNSGSSVDFSDLQPQHSPSTIPVGLGTPYRRP